MIAALPMYDFPQLRPAHDALWSAIARRLGAFGVREVPLRLSHHLVHREVWRREDLLFGQACEYPLAKSFGQHLTVLATPHYAAPGCVGSLYQSAVVVRADETAASLADLRGRRCAVNEIDSNSGMNLLRAAIAPFAAGSPFFDSVILSGSHQRSLELIAANQADVAAIDCVTFAHLQSIDSTLVRQLRILSWTPPSPSLPFVTARSTSVETRVYLRFALAAVFADADLASVRQRLLLQGIDLAPDVSYGRVLKLERDAIESRYARIH